MKVVVYGRFLLCSCRSLQRREDHARLRSQAPHQQLSLCPLRRFLGQGDRNASFQLIRNVERYFDPGEVDHWVLGREKGPRFDFEFIIWRMRTYTNRSLEGSFSGIQICKFCVISATFCFARSCLETSSLQRCKLRKYCRSQEMLQNEY